jgi:hypothetical protein
MFCTENIDKIAVTLNSLFLNYSYYNKPYLFPKYVTKTTKGHAYPTIFIEYEAFSNIGPIHYQVLNYIIPFITPSIILLAFPNEDIIHLLLRLSPYLFSVTEIEIFFNFKPTELVITKPENFIQFHDEDTPEIETLYSPDGRNGKTTKKCRKSIISYYDRRDYLLKKNQTSHEEIFKNPYFKRLEFRFVANNFAYLNFDNLQGTYQKVIRRHMEYLAAYYNRYVRDNVNVNISNKRHPLFMELLEESKNGRQRIRNGKLKSKTRNGKCFTTIKNDVKTRLMLETINEKSI